MAQIQRDHLIIFFAIMQAHNESQQAQNVAESEIVYKYLYIWMLYKYYISIGIRSISN